MPVTYYVGEDAVRFLHDLARGRFIAIVTDAVRQILGRDIPSRSLLGEPEVIVDVYRNRRGEVVVAVIPREDQNALLSLPPESQERIIRELQKPEWRPTAVLLRGLAKSIPSFALETGLRMLGGWLAGPAGAAAGTISGIASGVSKGWRTVRALRHAIWLRRVARAIPALKQAPKAWKVLGSPAVLYGLTDVVPNIVGWVSQEAFQLKSQPPEVRRGYLPAFAVGFGQGVFDVALRRFYPASRVARVFEHPVAGTFLHGTTGMAAYSALQRWVSGRDIDVGEVLTEAVPTGLMGAMLPASIWAAGKLGSWLRRRLPTYMPPGRRLPSAPPSAPPHPQQPGGQVPAPGTQPPGVPPATPGTPSPAPGIPPATSGTPSPIPGMPPATSGVPIPHAPAPSAPQPQPTGIPRTRIPELDIEKPLTYDQFTSLAGNFKSRYQKVIEGIVRGAPPWEASYLMSALGIYDVNELMAKGADLSIGILGERIKGGAKFTKDRAATFIVDLLQEGENLIRNLPVEEEAVAIRHIDRMLSVMEARGDFVSGPTWVNHYKQVKLRPMEAASDAVRQGYLREIGATDEPPRGILDKRASYMARRIVEAVRRSGDRKMQASLMLAFGARTFDEAEVKLAQYIRRRYTRLVKVHGIVDDGAVLWEIMYRLQNVRERFDRLPRPKKVDVSDVEGHVMANSVLKKGEAVVQAIAAALGIGDRELLEKALALEYQRLKKEYGKDARAEFERWINRLIAQGKAMLGMDVEVKYVGPEADEALEAIKAAAEKWGRGEPLSEEEERLLEGYILTRDSEGNVVVTFARQEPQAERVEGEPPKTRGELLDELLRRRRRGVSPEEEAAPAEEVPVPEGALEGVESVDDTAPLPTKEAPPPAPQTELEKRAKLPPGVGVRIEVTPESPYAIGKVYATDDFVEIMPSLSDHTIFQFMEYAKVLLGQVLEQHTYQGQKLTPEQREKIFKTLINDMAASMQFLYQMTRWGVITDQPAVRLTMEKKPIIGKYTTGTDIPVIEISIPAYVEAFADILLTSEDKLAQYVMTGSYPVMLHEIVHSLVNKLVAEDKEFEAELMRWYYAVKKWAIENKDTNDLARAYYNIIEAYPEYNDSQLARELFTRVATLELAAVYPDKFYQLDRISRLTVLPFLTAQQVLVDIQRLDEAGLFEEADTLYKKYFVPMITPPKPRTMWEILAEAYRTDPERAVQLEFTERHFGDEEDARYSEIVDWETKLVAVEGYQVDKLDDVLDKDDGQRYIDFLTGVKPIRGNEKEFSLLISKLEEKQQQLIQELGALQAKKTELLQLPGIKSWEEFLREKWIAEREAFFEKLLQEGSLPETLTVRRMKLLEELAESMSEKPTALLPDSPKQKRIYRRKAEQAKQDVIEETYRLWLARNEQRLRQEYLAERERAVAPRIYIPAVVANREKEKVMQEVLEKTRKLNFIKRLIENLKAKQFEEQTRSLEDIKFEVEREYFIPAKVTQMGMQDIFRSLTITHVRPVSQDVREVYIGYIPTYQRFIAAIDLVEENAKEPITTHKFPEWGEGEKRKFAFTAAIPYRFLTDEERANFSIYSHHFPEAMTYMTEGLDPTFFKPTNRKKLAKYLTSSLRVLLETDPEKDRVLREIAIARLFEFVKALFAGKPKAKGKTKPTFLDILRGSILQTRRWNIEHYSLNAKAIDFVAFLVENAKKLVYVHRYFGGDRDIFDAIHLLLTYYQSHFVRPSDIGAPIDFILTIERGIRAFRDAVALRDQDPDAKKRYDKGMSNKSLRKRLENWYKYAALPFTIASHKKSSYRISLTDGRLAVQHVLSQVSLKTLEGIHDALKKLHDIYKKWGGAALDEQLKNEDRLDEIARNIERIRQLRTQKGDKRDIEALTLDTVMAAFQFLLENPVFIKAGWGQWGDEAAKIFNDVIYRLNPLMNTFLLGFVYPRLARNGAKYALLPFDFRALMHARYMERVKRLALKMNDKLSKSPPGYYTPNYWTEKDIEMIAHGAVDENMQVITLDIQRGGPGLSEPIAEGKYPPVLKGRKNNPGIAYYYLHNYPDPFIEKLRDWITEHPDRRHVPIIGQPGTPHPNFVLAALFSGYNLPPEKIAEYAAQATEVWDRFRVLWDKVHARYLSDSQNAATLEKMHQGYITPDRYSKDATKVALSLAYYRQQFLRTIVGIPVQDVSAHLWRLSDFVGFLEYFHYTRGSYNAKVKKRTTFPKVMSLRGAAALTIREFFELFEKTLTKEEKAELHELYKHPGFPWFAYTLELMLTHIRQAVEDPVVANASRRIDDDVEPPLRLHELVERRYRMIEAELPVEREEADETEEAVDIIEEALVSPGTLEDMEDAPTVYAEQLEKASDMLAAELKRQGALKITTTDPLREYRVLEENPISGEDFLKALYTFIDLWASDDTIRSIDVLEVPLRLTRVVDELLNYVDLSTRIDKLLSKNEIDEAIPLITQMGMIADSPGGFIQHAINTVETSEEFRRQLGLLRERHGDITYNVTAVEQAPFIRSALEEAGIRSERDIQEQRIRRVTIAFPPEEIPPEQAAEFVSTTPGIAAASPEEAVDIWKQLHPAARGFTVEVPRYKETYADAIPPESIVEKVKRISPFSESLSEARVEEIKKAENDWYRGLVLLTGAGQGSKGLRQLVSELVNVAESLYDDLERYMEVMEKRSFAEEIYEVEKAAASLDYTSPSTAMELEKGRPMTDDTGVLTTDTIELISQSFREKIVNPLLASDWVVVDEANQNINWDATEKQVIGAIAGFTDWLGQIYAAAGKGGEQVNVVLHPEFIPRARKALAAVNWLVDMSSKIVDYFNTPDISSVFNKNKDAARTVWQTGIDPIYSIYRSFKKDHSPAFGRVLTELDQNIRVLKQQVSLRVEGANEIAARLQELQALRNEMIDILTKLTKVDEEFTRLRYIYDSKPRTRKVARGVPPSDEEVMYAKLIPVTEAFDKIRPHITANANIIWARLNQFIGNIYNSFRLLAPTVGEYIEHLAHHLNESANRYKTRFFNLLDRAIKLTDELKKRFPQHAQFAHIDIAIALVNLHPMQPNFEQRLQEFDKQIAGLIQVLNRYATARQDPNIAAGESMRDFWDNEAYGGLVAGPHALIHRRIEVLQNDPDYAREVLNVATAYRVAADTMHAEARAHKIGIRDKKRGAIAEVVDYVEGYYPFIPSDAGMMVLSMLDDISGKLTKEDLESLGFGTLASEEYFKRLTNLKNKPSSFQHQIEFRRTLPWGWLFIMSDLNPVHAWLRYAQGLASLVGEYEAFDIITGMLRNNPDHYPYFKFTKAFLDKWEQENPDVAPPPDKLWNMVIEDAVNDGIAAGKIGVGKLMNPAKAKQQMYMFVGMLHGTYNPINLNDYHRPMVLNELFEGIKKINNELEKHGLTPESISFLLPLLTTKAGQAQYGRLLHTIEKSSPGLWNALSALTSFAVINAFSFRTALLNLPEGIAMSMGMALAKDGTFIGQLKDNLKMAISMLKGLGVATRKIFTRKFWDFYQNLLKGKFDPTVIDEFLNDETVRVILSRFNNTIYMGPMGRTLTQAAPEWWLHWASFFNWMEMFTLMKSAAALKAYLEDKAPIFKKVLAGTATPDEEAYVNRLLLHWKFGDVNEFKHIAAEEARKNGIDPKDVDALWERVRSYITYRGVFELHHEYGAWDMPELWHANPFVNRAFYWIRSFSIQQANKFLHHFITSKHKSLPAKAASALAMMIAYGMVIYPVMQMIYNTVTGDYDESPADLFSPVTWKGAIFNTIADIIGNPTTPLGIYGDAAAILEYAARSRSPMSAVRSVVSPLANMIVDAIWDAFQIAVGLVTRDPYAYEKVKEATERLIPMRAVFGKLIPHAMEKLGVEFPAASTTSRRLYAQLLRVFPMTEHWVTDQPHHNWQTKILPLMAQGDAHKLAHLILQTRPAVIYDVLTKGEKLTPTQYAKLLDAIEPVMRRFDPQEYERFVQIKPYLIQWANEQAAIQKQSAVINSAPILAVLEKYLFELLSELPDDLRNAVINHLIIGAVERGMQPSRLKAPSIPDIPVEAVVNAAAVGDVPKLRILGSAAAFMGRGLFKEALKAGTGIDDKTAEMFLHKLYSAVEEREDAWTIVDRATAHSAYYRAFKYTADALATVFDYVFPHMTHPRLKDHVGRIRQNIGIRLNSQYKAYADVFPPAIAMRKAWEDTMQDPEILNQIIALGDVIRTMQQPRILSFRRLLQGEKIQREPIVAYDYLIDANWFNILGRGERMEQRMARAGNVTFGEAPPEPYMLPSFLR